MITNKSRVNARWLAGGHLDRFSLGGRRRNRLSRQAWLAQAGLSVTPGQFAAVSGLSGLAAMALAWAVSGSLAIGLVPAIAAGFAPRALYANRRKARLHAVTEAWPDGILHVLGALRSGLSVHGATVDLIVSGPEALREAFANYEAWARVSSPAWSTAPVCPRSIACPACHARPGTRCKRPSGHEAAMHADRWRRAEALDAEDGVTYTGLRAGSRR